MIFLLDVNVLVAVIDDEHPHHIAAQQWFPSILESGWATCAITENGALRVVSQPRYAGTSRNVARVAESLRVLVAQPGHVFWQDDLSLLDGSWVDMSKISHPREITDAYLLALAAANKGKLATFDRRLSPLAVRHGRAALFQIPAA